MHNRLIADPVQPLFQYLAPTENVSNVMVHIICDIHYALAQRLDKRQPQHTVNQQCVRFQFSAQVFHKIW